VYERPTLQSVGSGDFSLDARPLGCGALYLRPLRAGNADRRAHTEHVDGLREQLLRESRLSRRTVQKVMNMLFGICKRAKRKKWIPANPCEDAERVKLRPSGHFNALSVEDVCAVVRLAPTKQYATVEVGRARERLSSSLGPPAGVLPARRCLGPAAPTWTRPEA
jgi:hypothetical protein